MKCVSAHLEENVDGMTVPYPRLNNNPLSHTDEFIVRIRLTARLFRDLLLGDDEHKSHLRPRGRGNIVVVVGVLRE